MADKAMSVLYRLKNKARETGKSYQLCLQLFCQEELLRRVAQSSYVGKLILKGGLFIYCLTGFESRPTVDIDFLLYHQDNAVSEIEQMIKRIIETETGNDFVIFEIKKIELIVQHRKYNGVRVQLIGRIKNTRTPFDVDFGVGDVVVPKPEKRVIPTLLSDFEKPEIMTYSLESTVAEKFDAIIARMELTSRMKDYFDIYYLANTFVFDGRKLQEAIFETLQNRGTFYDKSTFHSVVSFSERDDMNLKWRNFMRKLGSAGPTFDEVIRLIDVFLQGLFEAIVNEVEFIGCWNIDKLEWICL